MTNSSTRIPRCEVVGLREAIFAENPDLPVFGARALGLFLLCAPDPDVPEAQPAPGAARRALRRLPGHRLPRHRRLHAPDRPGPPSLCTDGGGPRPHGPADRGRRPA